MKIKNDTKTYGIVSILFHWLSVLLVVGLFILGLWMVGLDYYSEWYRFAPHMHKSIGVIFIIFVVLRIVWRIVNVNPSPLETHTKLEHVLSKLVHVALYGMLILMLPTGYLITTGGGQPLEVFNWFVIPSLVSGIEGLEYAALEVHELLAFGIIGLAGLHGIAAIKHHCWDKDKTLLRMLGKS